MPIKLIPPRKEIGQTNFYGRGTYLGIFVNRSTGASRPAIAKRVIQGWERDIERGRFENKNGPTFMSAAVAYMNAGGDRRPVAKLIAHFRDTPLAELGQTEIDAAAVAMFPTHAAATRNREVYTPVSAIMKQAGVLMPLRRPKGSRGQQLQGWLWPEEAERLFASCEAKDLEFGIFVRVLVYTGLRLTECARRFTIDGLRLSEGFAFIGKTKNGNPRPVHLPPHIVAALANHPRGLERKGETVFRFHKCGRLYTWINEAAKVAGVVLPPRQKFHLMRHTYGTWMRRYGGLDTRGLVGTGAWDSEQAAGRYAHTIASEDARKADLLPTGKKKSN